MTYVDLVGLISTFLIGLGIAGVIADRIYRDCGDRRHQAHRR